MKKCVKQCFVAAAACGMAAVTVPAWAVDVPVPNGNMDSWASGPLIDGRDVFPVNGATLPNPPQDGWLNWANHTNGGYLRFWNPSTTNRWTNANNEFFDMSWGGGDASGDANGYVLAVRTHSIDGAGGTTAGLLDAYGNRTFAVATTAANSTPAGFSYTWATELPIRDFEAAASRLTQTFDPTAKYTLSVKVGRLHADGFNTGAAITPGPDATYGTGDDVNTTSSRFANDAPALFDGYRVDLMAGGVQGSGGNNGGFAYGTTADPNAGDYVGTIGSDTGGAGSIAADSWITSTVAYVPNPATQSAMNGLAGKNLIIRLAALENADHAYTSAAAFDDVVLTKIIAGDANENDVVDFTDLNIQLGNYNGPTTGQTWNTGDFTGNGDVEFNDLNLLLGNYNVVATPVTSPTSATKASSLEASLSSEPEAVAAGEVELVVNPDGSLQLEGNTATILSYQIKSTSGLIIPDGDGSPADAGFLFYASNTAFEIAAAGFAPVGINGLVNIDPAINPLSLGSLDLTFAYGIVGGQTVQGVVRVIPVPEPASLALLGIGSVMFIRRRRAA